ncbi:ribokinase [Rhodopseudomonas sp. P2A-2r]|uniref:ribokinase n=1 Tax=Rhodopseudomonas sp. P2A-2r TaxID=2991972 RepID=UPI0022340263|nr:ribokinase [Rhodopseudomonas sp. P2A-2r]UZE47894.1 ribokinase [Rhodopseudomonas sp. P2A-2r]
MRSNIHLFVVGSFVAASAAKVERLPKPGESLTAHAFALEPGGKGFNLAVACRRLGANVDGVLPVGDDMLSGLAVPALERARLPGEMLRRLPGATGAGIGFIDAQGENCLAVFPGANGRLGADDVREKQAAISKANITLAQFEVGDEPIIAAFEIAREAGKTTLLNPSPFRKLDHRLLALTTILVLNASEAADMASDLAGASRSPFDAHGLTEIQTFAEAVMTMGPAIVVVTLGQGGAVFCRSGDLPLHQPCFPVIAIDTLGAGDAFAAGLAVSLAERQPREEVMAFASACGAVLASTWGVFDAFPDRAIVDAFLLDHC